MVFRLAFKPSEFNPNKEYPVGSFFKIGEEVFKVVNSVDNGFSLCCARDIVIEDNQDKIYRL